MMTDKQVEAIIRQAPVGIVWPLNHEVAIALEERFCQGGGWVAGQYLCRGAHEVPGDRCVYGWKLAERR